MLAALAADVEWVEGDIEGLPYRGVHRGPEAVGRDVFAQIPGAYASFELVPQEWVDGGDTIVMLGRVTVRLEGRKSSQSVAQVWKFQDGKITRFESFQDTLATARVLGAVAWTQRRPAGCRGTATLVAPILRSPVGCSRLNGTDYCFSRKAALPAQCSLAWEATARRPRDLRRERR